MIFVNIQADDGGADESIMTADEVIAHLRSSAHWSEAAVAFLAKKWKLGDWMKYPCGWIFCAKEVKYATAKRKE